MSSSAPTGASSSSPSPTGEELEEGRVDDVEAGDLLLPVDETLEDIEVPVPDAAPVGDDEEDAPVGALEDIDLEIEE